MSKRVALIAALERGLFPALRSQGFTGPLLEEGESDPEHAERDIGFHFRRAAENATAWVVLVHVKRSLRPTFVVIGAVVPPGGVRMVDPPELVPADRVTADMVPEQAYLQAAPGITGSRPFRQPLWSFLSGTTAGIDRVVRRAAELFPELQGWLEERRSSPWLWVIRWR